MVGMISFVVLVLHGGKPEQRRGNLAAAFLRSRPDKFSLWNGPLVRKKTGGLQCGAANLGVAPGVTSPILQISEFFADQLPVVGELTEHP
jgi:hypothetical protein